MTARPLHAPTPALKTLQLPVTGGHEIRVQTFGVPGGIPALVLHGGPGSGSSPILWRYLDPARYHIVVADQRGAGGSRPRGGTADNRTDDLLADLRQLRRHLGVARWLVVGGSWGAALALAHAADEPDAVSGLLLRAVFLARDEDLRWFFEGAAEEQPAAWRALAGAARDARHPRLLEWLHARLRDPDAGTRRQAAVDWWQWEQALAGRPHAVPPDDALDALIDRYRVQSHYLVHGCWLQAPPLLDRLDALPDRPVLILHSPADRICRPEAAEALHRRLPRSALRWVDGAGHDPAHPAMVDAMVSALDEYAAHGHFGAAR